MTKPELLLLQPIFRPPQKVIGPTLFFNQLNCKRSTCIGNRRETIRVKVGKVGGYRRNAHWLNWFPDGVYITHSR